MVYFVVFKQKTADEMRISDWSSDVCSSDLIRLVTALERRLPAVQIDPTHLEMAVLNILINARDAMPGGGIVTIATELWKLNGNAAAHGQIGRASCRERVGQYV